MKRFPKPLKVPQLRAVAPVMGPAVRPAGTAADGVVSPKTGGVVSPATGGVVSKNQRVDSFDSIDTSFVRESTPTSKPVNTDTPTKEALLVGINYTGTSSQLNGCLNDVEHVKQFLLTQGYSEDKIKIITDDTSQKPTKKAIVQALKNLCGKHSFRPLLWARVLRQGHEQRRNGRKRRVYSSHRLRKQRHDN
jgi:hypothetical protein